jgi:hypothetical protein
MSSRGNLWGNVSAAWCDELEPHTGKGTGGQERRLALGGKIQMNRFWLVMFNQTYLSRRETGQASYRCTFSREPRSQPVMLMSRLCQEATGCNPRSSMALEIISHPPFHVVPGVVHAY